MWLHAHVCVCLCKVPVNPCFFRVQSLAVGLTGARAPCYAPVLFARWLCVPSLPPADIVQLAMQYSVQCVVSLGVVASALPWFLVPMAPLMALFVYIAR